MIYIKDSIVIIVFIMLFIYLQNHNLVKFIDNI